MPGGRGPAPGVGAKPASQRRRRNAPEQLTVVIADGVYGSKLPDSFDWPAETLAWWESWRKSAQASKFEDTDWAFLLDTAVLHAEFWMGNRSVAGELRLRVAKFGATMEDRARLRLAIGEPPKDDAAPSKSARLRRKTTQRRGRLLSAVEDGKATG